MLTEEGNIHGCELIATVLGNVRESGYDWAKIRDGEAAARFVADEARRGSAAARTSATRAR